MKSAIKILVCDYIGNSAKWLQTFTISENYEIVGAITPASDKQLLLEKSWDYLLIFEKGARQFFNSMIQFMNIDVNNVIYAMDINSWTENPVAVFSIVNPQGGGAFYRRLLFNLVRQMNDFTTCTTSNGLNYITTSKDRVIMGNMYTNQRTWAEDDMKIFYDLANKYYKIDDSSGLFLDLGANIGTTGIYFTKILTPNLKLLAFEPDPEIFKMLRANLLLNDLEEKSTVENCGLGAAEGEENMYKISHNPGNNGMFSNSVKKDAPTEKIKIISLDKYFAEKNLRAEDVKYIWIDTEGFEAQVLSGAKNILAKNPAPIFMEFNPNWWQKSGAYKKMMSVLKDFYSEFIFVREGMRSGNFQPHPIDKLWEFQGSTIDFGGMDDIFLIKKS